MCRWRLYGEERGSPLGDGNGRGVGGTGRATGILYMFPILRVFCVKFEVFSKLTNYENFNVKC